jgi:hypothetical protein
MIKYDNKINDNNNLNLKSKQLESEFRPARLVSSCSHFA